jgi:uncharacterized damage-inducible protein DinB
MDAIVLIRRLHAHQRWANDRLLAAARLLTAEQLRRPIDVGQGSVLATLVHLYAASVLARRARGRTDPPAPATFASTTLTRWLRIVATIGARWEAFIERLTPADLRRLVVKRSTSSGAGRVYATPASDRCCCTCSRTPSSPPPRRAHAPPRRRRPAADVMLITLSRHEHGGDVSRTRRGTTLADPL